MHAPSARQSERAFKGPLDARSCSGNVQLEVPKIADKSVGLGRYLRFTIPCVGLYYPGAGVLLQNTDQPLGQLHSQDDQIIEGVHL